MTFCFNMLVSYDFYSNLRKGFIVLVDARKTSVLLYETRGHLQRASALLMQSLEESFNGTETSKMCTVVASYTWTVVFSSKNLVVFSSNGSFAIISSVFVVLTLLYFLEMSSFYRKFWANLKFPLTTYKRGFSARKFKSCEDSSYSIRNRWHCQLCSHTHRICRWGGLASESFPQDRREHVCNRSKWRYRKEITVRR